MTPMRIDFHFTPSQTDEFALREKTVVVIDVLRASTSIITALGNGAREIIPATTVEAAVKISGNLTVDVTLLGGERNGKMIEGFSLGNSPFDYSEEKVKGKAIVFSSTNGSQALVKSRFAQDVAVCGFVNIGAVSGFLKEKGRDFIIICAGNNGMFSMEDTVCGGMLIHLATGEDAAGWNLSDGALAALTLYRSFGKNILKMMKNSDHGKHLQEIGFGEDLKICAGVDTLPVVPQLDGNVIKLKKDMEKKETVPLSVPS